MFYLSEGTEFFSSDKLEGAQVMQRLFFEQYSHEPFIATSRFWYLMGKAEEYQEALQQKQAPSYGALGVMEPHLANHAFLQAIAILLLISVYLLTLTLRGKADLI